MRIFFGVLLAVFIVYVMGVIIVFLDAIVTVAQQDIDDKFTYVLIGLIPILPVILAIWLIKVSWRAIVTPAKLQVDSNPKANFYSDDNDLPNPEESELKSYEYRHDARQSTHDTSRPLKHLE